MMVMNYNILSKNLWTLSDKQNQGVPQGNYKKLKSQNQAQHMNFNWIFDREKKNNSAVRTF